LQRQAQLFSVMAPKAKSKKCPKEVLEHVKVEDWRAGLKAARMAGSDEELAEIYGYFKKCAGKDKILTRAEFIKNFTKKVKINDEAVSVADVELLFSATAIDYDYNTVSLHEFMTLMIVMKGGDPQKKLAWTFKMYDADKSGSLDSKEVEDMFGLLSTETNATKRRELVNKLMPLLDYNKDGKVTFEELRYAISTDAFMNEYVAKGKTVSSVTDAAFQGKSMACLVM